MRGVRARLTVTIVALVALTAAILGIGSYAFVDARIREQVRDDAAAQAAFDLSVLIPERLPPDATAGDIAQTRILESLRSRGVETIVDLGDGRPIGSRLGLGAAFDELSAGVRAAVDRGEIAYEWTRLEGAPVLVVAGRMPPAGPAFYFVHDMGRIEETLAALRLALGGGALALVLLALVAARLVARGVLAPVEAAGRAAERIELGDLSARVPVTSRDEFGAWAERFNRMAAALDATIGDLRAAQAQNRRFVADVSHELRTPLAALVAEASILRGDLDALPAASRRAGELLVGDVARLRTLVDELMELSRFDARAEQVAVESVDLGRLVASVVARHAPGAEMTLPDGPIRLVTDPRRLERILGNLLDNAREHAPGAAVAISVIVDGQAVAIAVDDRGPGVAEDRIERIFDRFYKADASRHGGSSGLGLAIAAEHAALLGGTLRASNRAGSGLRVELRLPVTGSLPGSNAMVIGPDDGGTHVPSEWETQP